MKGCYIMKNFNEKIVLAKSVGQYEFLQRKKVLSYKYSVIVPKDYIYSVTFECC